MAQESVAKLLNRYQKAQSTKDLYNSTYEAAYRYALPVRNIFYNKTKGDPKLNGIYDSTGIRAAVAWVANMQNAITPPFKKWVKLKLGPGFDVYKNNPETSEIHKQLTSRLEYATERGFSVLNSSNFNSIITQFYAELSAGTAVLMTIQNPDDDPVPMRFVVVPTEEIALESGPGNTVGAKFRKSNISVQNIKETWSDAKISDDIKRKVDEDPSYEVCVIEAFYTIKGITYYDVILEETQDRIVEREYKYNPVVVTRINPDPLGVYGFGPLVMATPDIRTLNKAKELMLRSSQLSVYGVYTVADNDVVNPNTLSISPGTFIPVSRNSGPNGPSIAPLPSAGNFNAQQFQIQELQANIREMLFDDKLPPDTGPVRSATEIVERLNNIRKTTGAFFGPINQEFIQHLWTNILHILVARGEIELQPELMNVDNFFVEVDVLSPIAKEQDIEDVQNFAQAYELTVQLVGPEQAQYTYKVEDVGRYVSEKLGVPIDLIRSKEEEEEMKLQIQQQAQMLEQQVEAANG